MKSLFLDRPKFDFSIVAGRGHKVALHWTPGDTVDILKSNSLKFKVNNPLLKPYFLGRTEKNWGLIEFILRKNLA